MNRPLLIAGFIAAFLALSAGAAHAQLGESAEIKFNSADAAPLRAQADELGSVVRIYEYVRNNAEYALYHGARSGSINSFLGLRGNDVDLGATLIAMLRYKGIPARYVVGDVRIPADRVTNWLGVRNLDLAVSIMKNQGIQNVALAPDRSYVQLEHVWVEAQVPFGRYRGIETGSATNCSAEPQKCNWVSLDPSFKLKQYKDNLIDVYAAPGFAGFNYATYYNAIKDNNAALKDKNPREIYEEQILQFLRTSFPGRTLEDVAYTGTILQENNYILPASLPYAIVPGATLRRYASVDEHDAATNEAKKWHKFVKVTATFPNGRFVRITTNLVALAIARFTMNMSPNGNSGIRIKIGGSTISISGLSAFGPLTVNGHVLDGNLGGMPMVLNEPYTLAIEAAGAPSVTSAPDRVITATYPGCVVGGFYLIGTGGDSSNWSQVHRAAEQLLAATQQYKIVFNTAEPGCDPASGVNCTPFIDSNNNGFDATDLRLIENDTAISDLTGGLLYVAMSQYFAKFREDVERLDALNQVKSPIEGFVGVVSSIFEVEYVDGTAFSVLPGGLLIDMKAQVFSGNWRIGAAAESAAKHFELMGHAMSSLEHEIWQELTGYDAVSTVRGIQMALATGSELVVATKSPSTDTVAAAYPKLGFSVGTAPAGFTLNERNVFSTRPASWTHPTAGSSFDIMKASIDASTPPLRLSRATFTYSGPNSGLEGWVACVDNNENTLLSFPSFASVSGQFCDGSFHSGTAASLLSELQTSYFNDVIPNRIGQQIFDYFNENNGFSPAQHVFRTNPIAFNAHTTEFVQLMRNELYLPPAGIWREHVLPSRQTCGASYRFSVRLRKHFETATNNLVAQQYEITNNSVGGSNCP